jgi:hypothetical protein
MMMMMMDKLRFRTLLLLLASITTLSIFTLLIHHNSISLLTTLFFKQQLQFEERGKDPNIIVTHSPGQSYLSIHYNNKSLIHYYLFIYLFSLLFVVLSDNKDQNAIIMSGGSKRNFQLQPPQTTNTSQTVSDIIIIG